MLIDPGTQELASVRASLAEVSGAVRAAQDLLDAGRPVDLQAMEARTQQLCSRALGLPPPLAQTTLPDLQALLGAMDALIETLTRQRP